MRFHYVCSDCGRVFETEGLMYQCPECAKRNDGKTFPYGNLRVELDESVLKRRWARRRSPLPRQAMQEPP